MSERIEVTRVGAPDPELKNSPIVDGFAANEQNGMDSDTVEMARCYFNGNAFADSSNVCSGDELLRCDKGTWIRVGTCEPENP